MQAEADGVGPPPGREHDRIAGDCAVARCHDGQAVARFLDGGGFGVAGDRDALRFHDVRQRMTQIVIEAAKNFASAIEKLHLDAKPVKDTRKFNRNITRPDNHDFIRQLFQMERFVRCDREFASSNLRDEGMSSRRNKNALRRNGAVLAGNPYRMRVQHLRAALDNRSARRLDAAAVDLADACDLGILVGDKRLPIEPLLASGPAIGARVVDGVAELARVDEQLLRYAAPDHAGASEAMFLGDGRANAETGGEPSRANAA